MPGADVEIGSNGPRYSRGAFNFISHVSTCEAPPHRKNRIVDFALPASESPVGELPAVSAALPQLMPTPGNPARPVADAARKERRFVRDIYSFQFKQLLSSAPRLLRTSHCQKL